MTNTNRKHDRAEFFRRICEYKATHDGRNPSYRKMAGWFNTSNAVISWMMGNLSDAGLIAYDDDGWYVVGGAWTLPGGASDPA